MAGNRVEYLLVLIVVSAYMAIHLVRGAVILALLALAFAVESVRALSCQRLFRVSGRRVNYFFPAQVIDANCACIPSVSRIGHQSQAVKA
jgi:hypothetical protein